MQKNDRVSFGSRIGAILAAAGSAVGLGNIWRFPYETGNHGGAAFIQCFRYLRNGVDNVRPALAVLPAVLL